MQPLQLYCALRVLAASSVLPSRDAANLRTNITRSKTHKINCNPTQTIAMRSAMNDDLCGTTWFTIRNCACCRFGLLLNFVCLSARALETATLSGLRRLSSFSRSLRFGIWNRQQSRIASLQFYCSARLRMRNLQFVSTVISITHPSMNAAWI